MPDRKRTTPEQKRITLTNVKALEPGQAIWDSTVRGFGARRQSGPAVSYVVIYRTPTGRQRMHTIGRHGQPWTPDEARDEAKRVLADVTKGHDPAGDKMIARKAMTVSDLCDLYWDDVTNGRFLTHFGRPKKASTLLSDRGRIDNHIKPILGKLAVKALTRKEVEDFLHSVAAGKTAKRVKTAKKSGLSNVRGGKGVATHTTKLLAAILAYAEDKGIRSDNPARRVRMFADNRRERRLSDDEYLAMGKALRQAEDDKLWPPAVAAIRLLLMTGWRLSEALTLRWGDVELPKRTATLPDTKTGKSIRPLSHAAVTVLRKMPRVGVADLVFPATRGDGPMAGFRSMWNRVTKLGNLPDDVTPHVLRHSFASLAADLGYSESTIGSLIGHKGHSITSRYMHTADAVLLAAADKIADETSSRLGNAQPKGEVVQLRPVGV